MMMVNIRKIVNSFASNPGYTAMRGVARFSTARKIVAKGRQVATRRNYEAYLQNVEVHMNESVFSEVDRHKFLDELNKDGLAFGLKLPASIVSEILEYADLATTYADRNPALGFKHHERIAAETKINKTILVSQYFNTIDDCGAIRRLAKDPFLLWIAGKYLESTPTFFGSNLWWTFPVQASEADRNLHAHLFHRDVDDFQFFKFFFYITDVPEGEGAHICVAASHVNPPSFKAGDRWNIRRYTDEEIESYYRSDAIKEICGPRGTGFAENTLCIHKGSTPKTEPRLLLQLQFGLFDYGFMKDEVSADRLGLI